MKRIKIQHAVISSCLTVALPHNGCCRFHTLCARHYNFRWHAGTHNTSGWFTLGSAVSCWRLTFQHSVDSRKWLHGMTLIRVRSTPSARWFRCRLDVRARNVINFPAHNSRPKSISGPVCFGGHALVLRKFIDAPLPHYWIPLCGGLCLFCFCSSVFRRRENCAI